VIKIIRRLAAVLTLIVVAAKGALSFLSWVEKQDEAQSVWVDEEDLEEAF
jgi:hypothetical protein